ncbi:MAG: PEP-CTERM sorting domain-containing protein [Nitrospirae bacterium]|nr:PEP-CTERM sorting domain-containing protein [Nitrospirota bacterium]
MKRLRAIKKAGQAAGVVLAAALVLSAVPKAAHATYLGTPTVSLTDTTGSTPFTVYYTNNNVQSSATLYYTGTSTYGATIPTAAEINAAGIPGTIDTIQTIDQTNVNYVPITFYNPSSGQNFTLKQVQTILDPFVATGSNGGSFTGNVLSNVFQVVGGSHSGDLVFSYQFNVTAESIAGTSLDSGSVSFFNEPLNASTGIGTPWTLGDGINGSLGDTGFVNDAVGSQLAGTVVVSRATQSTVTYDTVTNGNNSISSINYLGANIGVGEASPQFFVASNATTYSLGSFTFGGAGAGENGLDVFVPGTPEPGTLVLFGTALGLVAFMMARRRQGQGIA